MTDDRRGLFGLAGGGRKPQRVTPAAPRAAGSNASPRSSAGGPAPSPRSSAGGPAAKRADSGRRRRLAGAKVGQPDLGEVLRLVVDRVREFTGATGAAVGLLDGDAVVLRSATGSALAHLGLRVPLEGSLSGAAIREGKVLRCDDTTRDARIDGDLAFRLSARSLLVIPLYHLNRAVGTLTVISAKARSFDDRDAQTLEVMAQVISASLGNAASQE
ncbi:MAG TPA: GAF domain-containing protein, partial [Acidimicrobiales bacterium]|nr:GAF domain-containing protein [Acidimicrobiales bacterium]